MTVLLFTLLLVFCTSVNTNLQQTRNGIQLITSPRDVVVRLGQTLRINCTVTGSRAYNVKNITWKRTGQALAVGSRRLDNNTRQLVIPDVSPSDGGKYRCVLENEHAQVLLSTDTTILVGDRPSSPQKLRSRSVDWKMCLQWSPVLNTGGLTVTYRVLYRCISDCELDDGGDGMVNGWHEACKNTSHTPGRVLNCCLNNVILFLRYKAVVVARNAIGSTTSRPIKFRKGIKTTLRPPLSLEAKATGYGEITISWKPRLETRVWNVQYVIDYHAEGDSKNKTIIVTSSGQNFYRLTDLMPYIRYTVYIAARSKLSDGDGITLGPVVVYTREESPSVAPEIIDVISSVYPDNHRTRNVTVKWKLPPLQKWNGIPQRYIIQYRLYPTRFTKQTQTTMTRSWGEVLHVNESFATEAVIVGLQSDSKYEVEMEMCNGAGCSGIGNRVVINVIPPKKESTQLTQGSIWIWMAVLSALLLVVVTVGLVLLILKRIDHPGIITPQKTSCYPMKTGSTYNRMEGETV